MIAVEQLVKRYGSRLAVDGLSFGVGRGEVVGFLGPNGAGKSTTLRVLSGFLAATRGKVVVCGHDMATDALSAKAKIGYMPEAVPLYPEMRTAEYLAFRAELKGVRRKEREARVDEAMEKARVMDVANVLIGSLSKGYRQRVGLADALVARPPLLVLDEPTAGLDPNQIREVREVLKDLGGEHTVLLSTHILSEVEASCGRVLVIDKGRLVAEGTLAEVQRLRRPTGLTVKARGTAGQAREAVRALGKEEGALSRALEGLSIVTSGEPSVVTLSLRWPRGTKDLDAESASEALVRAAVAAGLGIREVAPLGSRLEDVFAELTGREAPGDRPAEEESP